ncbi:MAG: hypothetical protein ACYTE3_31415 [Planctomycetota bacterium]|jgi:hypothetical protein
MIDRNVEKVQEPRVLPVAELNGRDFFVDVEKRQFRNFANPVEMPGSYDSIL